MKDKVITLHNLAVSMVDAWQLERPHSTDIFQECKKIFDKMLEKSMQDDEYLQRYCNWLEQKTSTIALRELCNDVGFDYWSSLLITNAINTIDSSRLWWYGKQRDAIKARV